MPKICDQDVLADVLANQAPLYTAFLAAASPLPEGALPVPFEFSSAAFRFGHSMVRQSYDWNAFFNPADFIRLFQFTGSVQEPMLGVTNSKLPSNWVADWPRLAVMDANELIRTARSIDTDLSLELGNLPQGANESNPATVTNLASRNLRKGHRHNLPSAQTLISEINALTGQPIPTLSTAELTSGRNGQVLLEKGFENETPLWFYVLKEAEVHGRGNALGPLGTTIVANTLLGLVINDPDSYWHLPGSDAGRWHPADDVRPSGIVVDSVQSMLRAALVL